MEYLLSAWHCSNLFMCIILSISHGLSTILGWPIGSDGEASACNAGDQSLIPGLGRFPEEGNGSPLQYSCLENSLDRETWLATDHGPQRIKQDWATNTFTFPLAMFYRWESLNDVAAAKQGPFTLPRGTRLSVLQSPFQLQCSALWNQAVFRGHEARNMLLN